MDKNIYIHDFKSVVEHISLPGKFTNPFNYQPHSLCQIAAKELQQKLGDNLPEGKMYGILVVKGPNNKLAYLSSISGTQHTLSDIRFVPPVYDITDETGFFKLGEKELTLLNRQIQDLEKAVELNCLVKTLEEVKQRATCEIEAFKQKMKTDKKLRGEKRNNIINDYILNNKNYILEQLLKESKTQKSTFAKLKNQWKIKIQNHQNAIDAYLENIEKLKHTRKQKSAKLQRKLFEHYNFLNAEKQHANLLQIFEKTEQKIPPAAAGDCAAPKLMQFAFANSLTPVAMAEFWWGPSPKTEVRKQGYFYPACQSKCKPILGFMLKGLNVESNAVDESKNRLKIELVFEDENLAVIDKPAGLLSVPGKEVEESVFSQAQILYPKATGPLIVHRLDMATSGLMLVAKSKVVHKYLQKQFLNHTIQKRYVALLSGEIKNDEGFIELPLRVDLNDRPRQLVCYEHGKPAKTKYKVIKRENGKTLVHFFPITGRTHQLRVHAAHHLGLNTPIVGDELYGVKDKRLHLHAESISFIHPVTERKMTFTVKAGF